MVATILAFAAVAILAIVIPADGLSVDSSVHIARHHLIARQISDPLTKRSARCKQRPSSSSVPQSTLSSTYTQAPAASPSSSHAASSSSPAQSLSPDTSTARTGKICIAWAEGDNPALANFLGAEVTMIYTWGPYKPSNTYGLWFVPMLWGTDQIADFQRLVVPGYADAVLGFNEPDLEAQSGIDPYYGASLWQQYIQPLKNGGYALISPAVTSAPTGKTWLQTFFGACDGCTFDAIALHWYGTDAQAFIAYVTDFHTTFGKNIWVTEFACQNFAGGPQADQSQVFAFMETVTSWMRSTSFVNHYCAFGVMTNMGNVSPLNQLMNNNGYPTALGDVYLDRQ